MRDYSTIHVDRVIRENDHGNSLLCLVDDRTRNVWLPRDQMAKPEDVSIGAENIDIEITTWLAKKENLI